MINLDNNQGWPNLVIHMDFPLSCFDLLLFSLDVSWFLLLFSLDVSWFVVIFPGNFFIFCYFPLTFLDFFPLKVSWFFVVVIFTWHFLIFFPQCFLIFYNFFSSSGHFLILLLLFLYISWYFCYFPWTFKDLLIFGPFCNFNITGIVKKSICYHCFLVTPATDDAGQF